MSETKSSQSKDAPEVLIVAAEASSALYGERIIQECKRRSLEVSFFGIGNKAMGTAGCELVEDAEKMAVVGLWEVLAHWKVISQAFKNLVEQARVRKPKLALLLDYPDFNLRMAKKLNGLVIPVYYFISPQIWAWRTGRVELIKKIIKKMLVVFPFEVPFYKNHGVEVSFVGHPLLDELSAAEQTSEQIFTERSKRGISSHHRLIGLLPGSRDSELHNNFAVQLQAAFLIAKQNPDTRFMVIVAPSLDTEIVKSFVPKEFDISIVFAKDDPFRLIKLCDVCIVASGTATLVTALAEVPMVIMYKMNALTASVARRVVKGRFFGMPNLILDSQVVPELFQEDASSKQIAGEILKYLQDSKYYQSTKAQLALIKTRLGSAGAIGRVVDEIQNALKGD